MIICGASVKRLERASKASGLGLDPTSFQNVFCLFDLYLHVSLYISPCTSPFLSLILALLVFSTLFHSLFFTSLSFSPSLSSHLFFLPQKIRDLQKFNVTRFWLSGFFRSAKKPFQTFGCARLCQARVKNGKCCSTGSVFVLQVEPGSDSNLGTYGWCPNSALAKLCQCFLVFIA